MPRKSKQADIDSALQQAQFIDAYDIETTLRELPSEEQIISLFRMRDQGRPAFIDRLSPQEFSLVDIKRIYGPGKYKVVTFADGSKEERVFEIDGPPVDFQARSTVVHDNRGYFTKKEDQALAVQPNPENGIMFMLLTEIREMRKELSGGNSRNILEDLKNYKELLMPQSFIGNGGHHIEGEILVDVFRQGMSLADKAVKGEETWLDVFKQFSPMLQQILGGISKQPLTPAVGSINVTQPFPPESKPLPLATGFMSIANELKMYLPTFVRAASVGSDPMIMVDLTINNIPPDKKQVVIEWLQGEKWLNDLCSLDPQASQAITLQSGWWQAFHDSLLKELTNPIQEEHDE